MKEKEVTKSTTISQRLDTDDFEKLKRIAEKDTRTVNNLINKILKEWLKNQR
jgi:hypothetical protein